jgi:hypothetical protein
LTNSAIMSRTAIIYLLAHARSALICQGAFVRSIQPLVDFSTSALAAAAVMVLVVVVADGRL